ncbi:MAG: hypothetical protein JW762_15650 [Dehalococcoidales bacterium]|nr:hypothetical protein [Dehalococcoidales bacterium]
MGDEKILWSGRPDPGMHFTLIDLFLVPFSVLWGGFAIYFELSGLLSEADQGNIDIESVLFGIPFVLVGIYLMFGRFIYKRWRKQRTYYAITNRRILALYTAFGKHFLELDINTVTDVNMHVWADGKGYLIFNEGKSSFYGRDQFPRNTGMDIFSYYKYPLALYDMPNANEVYRLIVDTKSKIA